MFNKLLGDFINGAISAHTSRIKNQDVSLKFFQNTLNIAELELYKFAFYQYGLPIIIKCGIVKNVEIVVPWATFQFDPVKVTIDDVYILASLPGEDLTDFVCEKNFYEIREHQLSAHREFAKRFNKILQQVSMQKLSRIAKRFMHSCSIKIKNLHVRIEIPNQGESDCHSLGFITSSINIFTPKPSKGIPQIIEKNIDFEQFAIYLDLNQDYSHYQNVNEFIEIMKMMSKIDENHQFLLNPSLIKAVMTSAADGNESDINIIMDLNDIVLSITKQQLTVISKMAVNVKKVFQHIFINECKKTTNLFDILNKNECCENNEKNDDFDENSYWMLFHELAKRKNNSLLDSFLDRILYRNKYIKNWNKLDKKSVRDKLLINLDHKLDYQAILFFQGVADFIKEHGMNNINYDKIYRFVGFDPLLLIPSFASRFTIFASSSSIKIKFLNQFDKLDCNSILKGFSISYGKKKMHIDIESFNILFESDKNQYDVLKPISNHKNLISIDASFQNFLTGSFSISTEQMNLNVDLTRILMFISKLDLNLINDTIKKIRIKEMNYKVDVEIKETHLLPIFKDNIVFDFGFDSLSIHQSESNQNEYLSLFSNLSFSHNNIYIFKNLDIKSSRIKDFLNISVPYFKVDLIEKNFQKLDELKNFLQSASLLSKKAPLRLKNINVKLDGIDVCSDLLKNTISLKKSEIFYDENQNKSDLKSNISCIEIGYIVIKNLMFELGKQEERIQSVLSIDEFYFKELQIDIKSSVPFIKGTYNYTSETMDFDLGIDSIEFKNYFDILQIQSFIIELISLTSINKKEKSSSSINLLTIENENNDNLNQNNNDNENDCNLDKSNNNENDDDLNQNNNDNENDFNLNKSNNNDEDNNEKSFIKSILNLGNKELKIPKINLTIHFVTKPITIIYNKLNMLIYFEWSILFNPFALTLSIPSLIINYNKEKYLKVKNFGFIFSEKPEITISANQIAININEQFIQEMKNQVNKIKSIIQKLPKHLNPSMIPNTMINIESISLKLNKILKKQIIKIPITQFMAQINDKKDVDIKTFISMNCADIGIKIDPIDVSLAYKSRSGNTSVDLNVKNQLKIDFSPLQLKNLYSSDNIYYVNETGTDLTLIVDDEEFNIPDNSSYIASHLPNNTKICFSNHGSKAFLDISRLFGDQSLPCFINESLILVWKTKSLIVFSSTIEILNTTGCTIQLLDDCFHKALLPNNQIMFVDSLNEFKMKSISLKFLGSDFEVKANLTKNPYTIKNDDSYYRFIVERNPRTLVSRVTITATIFVRSYFPEPLLLEFPVRKGYQLYALYPKIKVPINLFDINESKISFNISSVDQNGFFRNCQYHVKISLSPGESTINLEDINHLRQTLYLRCRVTEEIINDNIIKIIDLSAPFILINHLGFSTVLTPSQDVKTLSLFQAEDQKEKDYLFQPLPHWPKIEFNCTPYCIQKEHEISFFLSHPPTLKYTKDKYVAMRFNSKELALLPTSKNDDNVMPVSFQVVHDESSTTTIILKPYVIIYNNTDQPINIDKKALPVQNYLIVRYASPSLDMIIDSHGLRIPINLEKISTFSVTGPSLQLKIQISVSFKDEIKCITVSTINTLGLFAAINETDKNFILNQTGIEEKQYFVLPQSSLLFDLTDTRTECSIDCFAENIPNFSVHLDRTMDFNPIPKIEKDEKQIFYSVEIVGNNRYVVHFTYEIPENENNDYSRMNFLLSIPMISIKIIGKNFKEYCRVTFGSFTFHILHQERKENIALSIESIQVDDMNEFADHPVVLLSQKKPFFNFNSMRTIKSTFFEYIIIRVTPIAAEIDVSFVIDMISLFKKNKIFYINQNRRIHCLLLDFLPIDIDISFFTNTPRQIHRFESKKSIPRFLSMLPTIDDFHIQLNPIKAADLQCTEEELILILIDNAKSSFSSHWLRLIGSASIIGNPQKLINNFSSAFKSPAKQMPKELLIGTAETFDTILKSSETTLKGISSTIRTVSHDDFQYISDNKTAIGGFSWGLKSFVSGVAKAATGIVKKPIERAKEKGLKGAIKGAGEGIVGIVTNSVGGAVDLTAGILTGVRRGIFGEKKPKRIAELVTKHRTYVTQMSKFDASDSSVNIINNLNFIYVSDEADICDDVIFVGEKEIKIDDINWIEKLENSKIVKIETKNKKKIEVEFKKEINANEFKSILQLQIERKMTQKVLTVPY